MNLVIKSKKKPKKKPKKNTIKNTIKKVKKKIKRNKFSKRKNKPNKRYRSNFYNQRAGVNSRTIPRTMGSTRPSPHTTGSTRRRGSPTGRRIGSRSSAGPRYEPIQDSYRCPISKKIMIYPVSINNDNDKRIYDLPCLITLNGISITHGNVLNPRAIIPLHDLRNKINIAVEYLSPQNKRDYYNRVNIYENHMNNWTLDHNLVRVNTNSKEFDTWHSRYDVSYKKIHNSNMSTVNMGTYPKHKLSNILYKPRTI